MRYGVLVGFCGGSYAIIRTERGKYDMDDVLAAFLPLLCIPSVTAILVGIYKWKDDGWKVSKAAFRLVAGGWLLLALVTILIGVKCWQVAGLFMFVLLLVFLGMAAAYRWVAHNFYLTRWEMVFVALMSLLLALGAFLFGILTGTSKTKLELWRHSLAHGWAQALSKAVGDTVSKAVNKEKEGNESGQRSAQGAYGEERMQKRERELWLRGKMHVPLVS
ncbi:hypothetical protein CBR_g23686 [Chara braunii]|uniref:Uncharacterized protein n=1 Tax=Chara braunii TaxID=69332 RepID=A0A388L4X4_CHABU|nr:hypothetical protein CBR_g23686 [Chara braunii]|eukprot:GBG77354.1 hypothetical protein CBR_g23686 [Chara braunii]